MATQNTNPFVLPGMGQGGDMAQNPLMASMEMMRQAWQNLAGPSGLAQSSMAAPMTIEDLDRRIADLRTVENWLRMNLSMLTSTIQGMEVQRATISTLKSFMGAAGAGTAGTGTDSGGPSPLEVALGIRSGTPTQAANSGSAGKAPSAGAAWWPGAAGQHGQASQPAGATGSRDPGNQPADGAAPQGQADDTANTQHAAQGPAGAGTSGPGQAPAESSQASQGTGKAGQAGSVQSAAGSGQPGAASAFGMDSAAAEAAAKGWWNMLQSQFDNLAAATAATMQGADAARAAAASAATPSSGTRKSAGAKPSSDTKKSPDTNKSSSGSSPARTTVKSTGPKAAASKKAASKAAPRKRAAPASKKAKS